MLRLPTGELADNTASSPDEEGVGVFKDDDVYGRKLAIRTEGDVTKQERKDLQLTNEDMPTKDDQGTDENGENLTEEGFDEEISGSDVDVPSSKENEENNPYSVGDNDTSEPTNKVTLLTMKLYLEKLKEFQTCKP